MTFKSQPNGNKQQKKLYYNKVVKRYQEGKSYAVISKELSLGVKTVEHWVHDFIGYTPRSSLPTMRTLYFDKAMALYQNGSSVKDIANNFLYVQELWLFGYKRTHPESYSKTLKETYALTTSRSSRITKTVMNCLKCLDNLMTSESGAICKDTFLYKLTWKQSFPKEINGKPTFYGMLLKMVKSRNLLKCIN